MTNIVNFFNKKDNRGGYLSIVHYIFKKIINIYIKKNTDACLVFPS